MTVYPVVYLFYKNRLVWETVRYYSYPVMLGESVIVSYTLAYAACHYFNGGFQLIWSFLIPNLIVNIGMNLIFQLYQKPAI